MPKPARTATEIISSQPTFIVEWTDDWAKVVCPRADCQQPFMVKIKTWRNPPRKLTAVTRPCPYCFRVGHIPKRRRRSG